VRDDGLQEFVHPQAHLGRNRNGNVGIQAQIMVDLMLDAFDIGARHIDLVDDGDDLQIVIHRHIEVRKRLRLDSLSGVNHEQRPLATGNGPAHFVAEVRVPRSVDQIQNVGLSVGRRVGQTNGLALDRDAAFTLDVHIVQKLVLKVPVVDDLRPLNEAIS